MTNLSLIELNKEHQLKISNKRIYIPFLINLFISLNRLPLKRGTGNGEWGTRIGEIALSAIFKKGNGEQGTGNREPGMRLTIFHETLHTKQFEGAEFIDGNSFL